jgi:hypothetical protein
LASRVKPYPRTLLARLASAEINLLGEAIFAKVWNTPSLLSKALIKIEEIACTFL